MLGHSGYLETARRAFVYALGVNGVQASPDEIKEFMRTWQELSPFPDVTPALERLKTGDRVVILSNGEPGFLEHLVKTRVRRKCDEVILVQVVGAFKPHPGVYLRAARILRLEANQCVMVSANTFDVMEARACGYRGAFENRYGLAYEDSPYRPDVVVLDFKGLADSLLSPEEFMGTSGRIRIRWAHALSV
jgi:2-haloacid dehalogenase